LVILFTHALKTVECAVKHIKKSEPLNPECTTCSKKRAADDESTDIDFGENVIIEAADKRLEYDTDYRASLADLARV